MALKSMSDGEGGFHLFDKGKNTFIKIYRLDPDTGSFQGNDYQQFKMIFDAASETDVSEQGRIPFYPSSKITITDSAEHTSDLGKLLKAANILEDVLSEILDSGENVQSVVSGENRYVADNADENEELGKAIAKHLNDKVLIAGTKFNSEDDPAYSMVNEPHRLADKEPFSEDDSDSEEGAEEESQETIFDEDEEEE